MSDAYKDTIYQDDPRIAELEAQVTLLSERFNGANGRLEDMTNKRNALDIVIAGLKAQVAELREAAQAVVELKGDASYHSPHELVAAINALAALMEGQVDEHSRL